MKPQKMSDTDLVLALDALPVDREGCARACTTTRDVATERAQLQAEIKRRGLSLDQTERIRRAGYCD